MVEDWVVNASPLIALGSIGRLDLLEGADRRLIVPAAVATEVLAGPDTDGGQRALAAGWIAERPDVAVRAEVLEWGLGAGESAVLSAVLASTTPALAVLDDGAARRCARALGARVIGTLGIVLRAKIGGRIAAATPVVRALRGAGLYLDDALVRRALLEIVGEKWEE